MKNFSLLLLLTLTTAQGVAFGKNRLPRLATEFLSEIVPLSSGKITFTNSLAMLPLDILDESGNAKLHWQKLRKTPRGNTAVIVAAMVGAYAYILFRYPNDTYRIEYIGAAAAIYGLNKIAEQIRMENDLKKILMAQIIKKNLFIYESNDLYRVGLLTHVDKELAIVDAQGNEKTIKPEQFVQLVALRNSLPPTSFSSWMFSHKQSPISLSADSAEAYHGATLAFTNRTRNRIRNYLGIVEDISFDTDGQGELSVVTAAGEELRITRGKRGEPTVATGGIEFDKGDQLRGVLFLP